MLYPDVALHIIINEADIDAEQFDTTTLRLIRELRDVGVESISRATLPTQEGAKTGAAFAPGTVNISVEPNLVTKVLHYLNTWTTRGRQRTVRIETPDGMKIEFTPDKAPSTAEMMAFVQVLCSTAKTDTNQPYESPLASRYRVPLRELLVAYFDESELQMLCFYLGITYEDLSGQNRSDKINAMITHIERRKRIDELLSVGQKLRPELAWQRIHPKA